MRPEIKRIVLTGGPCAGKTTIAQVISVTFSEKMVVLPEAATLIYRGGFPRFPEVECQKAIQRSVYRVQSELETIYPVHYHDQKCFMMDRGTVDGAAYWGEGKDSFFREMGTTQEREFARYDRVIYLASISESLYRQNVLVNPTRTESWPEAQELDRAIHSLWKDHPGFIEIQSSPSFQEKINQVISVVRRELGL